MSKLKRLLTILILLISVFSQFSTHIFAMSENDMQSKGLTINPAKIDIVESKYNYEVQVTNNDNYDVNLDIYLDKLSRLGDELGKSLIISPYLLLETNKISLKSGESKKIEFAISPEIKTADHPLYGDLIIKTSNPTSKQTTIDHGIAVPIYRNMSSSFVSKNIEIKNLNFTKDILDPSNKSKISFEIVNKGDFIFKVFGAYDIKNSKNETIFQKEFSSDDTTLLPGESKKIEDTSVLDGLIDKFTLSAYVSDGTGDVLQKSSTDLILLHPYVILSIILIIILIVLLYLKGESLKKKFSKYLPKRGLKLRSIITTIILLSVILSQINFVLAQSMGSTDYKIPDSNFSNGNTSTGSTYKIRDEQGAKFNGFGSSTSYGVMNGVSSTYYAYVPTAPIVSNNGYYSDRLSVILSNSGTPPAGNPTDTDFAIGVTSSSYSGIKWVQSDNTLGTTLDSTTGWRKYSGGTTNWGNTTGIIVLGLSMSTSYTFYVKARHQAGTNSLPASETAIVLSPASNATPHTTASTMMPSLAFQILGVSAGGNNTTTSTPTSVDYGQLSVSTPKTASSTLRVTTNAQNGYNINLKVNQKLTSGTNTIDFFNSSSATYLSPQLWTSPTGNYPNAGWIGYHTDNTQISQFQSGGTKFAPFPVDPSNDKVVEYLTQQNNTPVDDNISYKIEINSAQPAGIYSSMTITYILTGLF